MTLTFFEIYWKFFLTDPLFCIILMLLRSIEGPIQFFKKLKKSHHKNKYFLYDMRDIPSSLSSELPMTIRIPFVIVISGRSSQIKVTASQMKKDISDRKSISYRKYHQRRIVISHTWMKNFQIRLILISLNQSFSIARWIQQVEVSRYFSDFYFFYKIKMD